MLFLHVLGWGLFFWFSKSNPALAGPGTLTFTFDLRHAFDGRGLDTASEIALLGVSAGVAAQHVPFLAVLSLPVLVAAGMSLMDTSDGAFMSHAYSWAFAHQVQELPVSLGDDVGAVGRNFSPGSPDHDGRVSARCRLPGNRGKPSSGKDSQLTAKATNCRTDGLTPGSSSKVPIRIPIDSGWLALDP